MDATSLSGASILEGWPNTKKMPRPEGQSVSMSLSGQSQYQYILLLVLLMVIGLWLRIRNLGDLSLFVDEGVQALAVEAILQQGLPVMDSGLVYLRAPLYLYMQAALTYLFDLNEFWLRLPSVIWGVAAIIPTYILGKTLFNRPVGALAAIIIALSAWEIELSRYARPYIAFQFLFLVSLICFYRGFMLDERKFRIWFLIVAFFTLLTHELSQVLIVLFAIPLFFPAFTWTRKLQFSLWGLGLGGLMFILQKPTGFHLPESMSYPSAAEPAVTGIMDRITSALGIPSLHGPDMSHFIHVAHQDPIVMGALLLVTGITTIYLFYQLFRAGRGWRVLLELLMLWSAFAYQFGLVLLFFVVYLAIFARDLQIFRDRIFIAVLGATVACFVVWFIVLARSPQLLLVEVPLALFSFPDIYKYLFRWLLKGWPVMTIILAIGSMLLFVRFVQDRRDAASLFLLGALYVPAVFASLFESAFVPVYTLHLYPLIVLIVALVTWNIGTLIWRYVRLENMFSRRLTVLVGILMILIISQDANPISAWRVSERTYQSEKHPIRNIMTFRIYSDFHQDVQGPSLFVKKHMTDQDIVAVIGMDHATQLSHYYIGKVDYALTAEEKASEFGLVKQGNLIHYTTGYAFITDPSELRKLIQDHSGKLWLVGDRRILRKGYPIESAEPIKEIVRELAKQPDYVGRDGITFAVKVH